MIPQFEEKVLEHRDGHYVVQDWKGNICEISDKFDVTYLRKAMDFVTRRWIKLPGRDAATTGSEMKKRYDPDAPGRFPADFADRCRRAARARLASAPSASTARSGRCASGAASRGCA